MTDERRLKDIKGYQVWKMVENKVCASEEIYYMLNTQEGDNVNIFRNLSDLKKYTRDL